MWRPFVLITCLMRTAASCDQCLSLMRVFLSTFFTLFVIDHQIKSAHRKLEKGPQQTRNNYVMQSIKLSWVLSMRLDATFSNVKFSFIQNSYALFLDVPGFTTLLTFVKQLFTP